MTMIATITTGNSNPSDDEMVMVLMMTSMRRWME